MRELAADNPGLCVITTRLGVTDLKGLAGVEVVDLEKLPATAGAELLRQLGAGKGSDQELRAASEELRGHGLALTLLGTYLRDVLEGDVRRRREAVILGPAIEGGEHARHVMEAYERWLGDGPELQALFLLGLFDRPAEVKAVAALRAGPVVQELTEKIWVGEERQWQLALSRLRQAQLVAPTEGGDGGGEGALDAHPLVREHFGERLRQASPEAWRAGNERLYEYYYSAAPDYPGTLDSLLPLYSALVHGCRAGREQEAFDMVYWRRILRGKEFFSVKKLGAFGAELTALATFFDRPWDQPSTRLMGADQAWLLSAAGFHLRALGRAEPEDGSEPAGDARYRNACEEVLKRGHELVKLADERRGRNLGLLDIALSYLALGRAHIGLALTAPGVFRVFQAAAEHLDRAVDGLRLAGDDEYVARGLLARAALRRLTSDFPAAAADLREAKEIAERGSMRLHEADAHLEWTRLHLATGDLAAARLSLVRARDLVRACGYGRREREVAWLERRVVAAAGVEN